MDFELSETERLFAETARRVVARDVEPVLAAHPADRPLPKAVVLDLYRAPTSRPTGAGSRRRRSSTATTT